MNYNKSFDFWNEEHEDCNCGSYAFNLDEWYHPGCICGRYDDCDDDVITFLDSWSDEGIDDDELANELASFYLDKIENDFEGEIRIVHDFELPTYVCPGEEVIAFRAGAYAWKGYNCSSFDYDFHFKVLRDGHWFEKRGSEPIRATNLNEWTASIYYNSETFFIIHRLQNLTYVEKSDILFIE